MVEHDRPEIRTLELDDFLSAPPDEIPRRLNAREALALFKAAARAQDAEALLEDAALSPLLVLTLWRWARAAATALGVCTEDETLDSALGDIDPCPWTRRLVPRPTPVQRALLRQGATSALYRACGGDGITLLPPRDGRIVAWCEALESVAEDLGLRKGRRGPDCLRLLSDPATAMMVPVSARAIYKLEDLLIDQAQRVLFRHGERGVMDHFREQYTLGRRECLCLVRLARADAMTYGRSSVEDDRAMMVAQLKDYVDRAREAMNQDGEMKGLRELARVQGLTRTEPEDKMSEFLGVVRRVSGRQDALQLVSAAADVVGAQPEEISDELESLPTDAEYTVKEGDVLAAFDASDPRAPVEEEVG